MRTFVMGDIHGAYKALVQCLERSNFNPEIDCLVQLGDVTDRWPEVYECVEALLQIAKHDKLIVLKGNHDAWFLSFINTAHHPGNWAHGGKETIRSYVNHREQPVKILSSGGYNNSITPKDIPISHQAFFKNQINHYIDSENNCFVHGGFNRQLPFMEQDENNYYWDRELWRDAMSFEVLHEQGTESFFMKTPFREIFIGHSPTTQWNTDQPMHAANIWNLDTGAGEKGRLTIMDVTSKQFWQSDLVKELYNA